MLLTFVMFMLPCFVKPVGYDFGKISFYGKESAKHRMANGRRFDPRKLTAASYAYPLGTVLEVTNEENGRRVIVEVTDRGPAKHLHRLVDVSEEAARVLDFRHSGVIDAAVMVVRYQ